MTARTFAEFVIVSSTLTLAEISKVIREDPDQGSSRGDVTKAGIVLDYSAWLVGSGRSPSEDIDTHLSALLARIRTPLERLEEAGTNATCLLRIIQ